MEAGFRIETMRPEQIQACRVKADVAFLPLGTLEWHGIHGPVGTDAIKAHGVCCAAAEKLGGGAVFPSLIWGVPRDSFFVDTSSAWQSMVTQAYGIEEDPSEALTPHGGLDAQEQWLHYQRVVRMSLEQIAGFGFRSIYLCSGHNPLVHWAGPVAKAFSRMTATAGHAVTTDWGGEFDAPGLEGDHAGKWETSLVMALAPESVDLEAITRRPDYRGVGAGLDAEVSTAEQGRAWLDACAEAIAREARWLVDHHPALPARHAHRR